MIGRAAQGWPWIFREIAHYLATGGILPEPPVAEIRGTCWVIWTICTVFTAPTPVCGWPVSISRGTARDSQGVRCSATVNHVETVEQQLAMTREFFDRLAAGEEMAA